MRSKGTKHKNSLIEGLSTFHFTFFLRFHVFSRIKIQFVPQMLFQKRICALRDKGFEERYIPKKIITANGF